jgi:hypothetical protein
MTPRAWRWLAVLVTGDAVAWLLTLNAQSSYHSTPGGPSTTLGIVLGWIISIGLFIAAVLVVLASRQAKAYQRPTRRPPTTGR